MRKKRNLVRDGKRPVMKAPGVLRNRHGMEMVQVAILIALAVALGIIFRTEITAFVNKVFGTLNS